MDDGCPVPETSPGRSGSDATSEASGYVSGGFIAVDGGYLAR